MNTIQVTQSMLMDFTKPLFYKYLPLFEAEVMCDPRSASNKQGRDGM